MAGAGKYDIAKEINMGSNPVSFLDAMAPGIPEAAVGLLSLLGPSEKTKLKWKRQNWEEMMKTKLGAVKSNMKPNLPYFNFAQSAGPMTDLFNKLMAGKAQMYFGQNSAPWGMNFADTFAKLGASTAKPMTAQALPPWAANVRG